MKIHALSSYFVKITSRSANATIFSFISDNVIQIWLFQLINGKNRATFILTQIVLSSNELTHRKEKSHDNVTFANFKIKKGYRTALQNEKKNAGKQNWTWPIFGRSSFFDSLPK